MSERSGLWAWIYFLCAVGGATIGWACVRFVGFIYDLVHHVR